MSWSTRILIWAGNLIFSPNWLSHQGRQILLAIHQRLRPHHRLRIQSRFDYFKPIIGRQSVDDYYQVMIAHAQQSWRMLNKPPSRLRESLKTPQSWDDVLKRKVPQVFWGLHSGPFEWMHQLLCLSSRPVHLITLEPPTSPLSQLRKQHHVNLIIWSHLKLSKAIRECKRDCGILAILVDQGPQEFSQVQNIFQEEIPLFMKTLSTLQDLKFESHFFQISSVFSTIPTTPQYINQGYELFHQETTSMETQGHLRLIEARIQAHPLDYIWHYKPHWPSIKK